MIRINSTKICPSCSTRQPDWSQDPYCPECADMLIDEETFDKPNYSTNQYETEYTVYTTISDGVVMYIPDPKKIAKGYMAFNIHDAKKFTNKSKAYATAGSLTKNSKNGYVWKVREI